MALELSNITSNITSDFTEGSLPAVTFSISNRIQRLSVGLYVETRKSLIIFHKTLVD